MILTASVLFPEMGETAILAILIGGTVFALCIAAAFLFSRNDDRKVWTDSFGRMIWRMPPLDRLPPPHMITLRGYLIVAGGLVLVRIVELAVGGA